MSNLQHKGPPGVVVTYPNRASEPEHERVVHQALARRLADLQGLTYAGEYRPDEPCEGRRYFLPSGPVVGLALARSLGLDGEHDLFGGVVPEAFVATKAITHCLVREDAAAPASWSRTFGRQVQASVLAGYTAFTLDDIRLAARQLLADGPLRIKPVLASAGRGQVRIEDLATLEAHIAALDPGELARFGLVLEQHLEEVVTISVGQVRIAGQVLSYYGTQRLTRDNAGEPVYGGSDLWVVPGDFASLLRLDLPDDMRLAIGQAQHFDAAASACYPTFFASRRNYDVALGTDARGHRRSGVLEQSWRVGGASSAEIAALEVFRQEPGRAQVQVSSVELYGSQQAPPGATVLYRGLDAHVGDIGKYVMVRDDGSEL